MIKLVVIACVLALVIAATVLVLALNWSADAGERAMGYKQVESWGPREKE